MKERGREVWKALLTGISYIMPFAAAGGILTAVGEWSARSEIFCLGEMVLKMIFPVMGAAVAFAIGEKPALLSGFLSGMLALQLKERFFISAAAGVCSGYFVKAIKRIPIPRGLQVLKTALIIPMLSALCMLFLMRAMEWPPFVLLQEGLLDFIQSLQGEKMILFGIVQGCMLAADLGGPLNKGAYMLAIAAFSEENRFLMAGDFTASMIPPLSAGIILFLKREEDLENAPIMARECFLGGLAMVTEYALPLAGRCPKLYLPCFMAGSAMGAAISYFFELKMNVPHGGIFGVLFCSNAVGFIISVTAGTVLSVSLILIRKKLSCQKSTNQER